MRRQLAHLALVMGLAASPVLAQSLFFPARSDFETGFSGFLGTRVATGDFDGDGNLDAAVSLEEGSLSLSDPNDQESLIIFKGDGRGLFIDRTPLGVPLGAGAGDVVTGHFDGDSNLDVAIAVEDVDGVPMGPGGIFIFNGDGNFDFTGNAPLVAGTALVNITALAAGDLNGDSQDDLVIINSADNTFTVFLSPGYAGVVNQLSCTRPVALDIGRLNADAFLDLAVVCDNPIAGADAIQTWRNVTGDGSLTAFPASAQPAPSTLADPSAIVIADLNDDNFNDLAVANSCFESPAIPSMDCPGANTPLEVSSLTLMRNDGSGSFGTDEFNASGYGSFGGRFPVSIAAGDIDGDETQDLLLANLDTQDISVLAATITGTGFAAQPTYVETFFSAGFDVFDAVYGDLNDDGTPDIVSTNINEFTGTLSTHLGGGDDLVLRATDYNPPTNTVFRPNAVAIADFNGDGFDDFAVANLDNDTASVFVSTAGDANATQPFLPNAVLSFNVFDSPFDILAADLDSDGDQDLLVLLSPPSVDADPNDADPPVTDPGYVRIFTNSGSATFVASGDLPVGRLPWSMVLADLDGSNGADLAVTNMLDHTVSLFSADSTTTVGFTAEGSFSTTNPNTVTTCGTDDPYDGSQDRDCLPTGIAAGNFDTLSGVDLVVSNFGDVFSGGNLQVFSGNGSFGFSQATELESPDPLFPSDSVNHAVVHSADLNDDGFLDVLAVGLFPDDYISVFMNNGAGNLTFTPASDSPFLMTAMDSAPFAPRNSELTDLNNDDVLDLLVAGLYSNNGAVMLGNGDGTFDDTALRAQAFGTIKEPNAIGFGDFNGDGLPDMLALSSRTDDVSVTWSGMVARSDLNGSGRVDGFDLALLGRLFGTATTDFYLDINLDGTIDAMDQAILATAFGQSF